MKNIKFAMLTLSVLLTVSGLRAFAQDTSSLNRAGHSFDTGMHSAQSVPMHSPSLAPTTTPAAGAVPNGTQPTIGTQPGAQPNGTQNAPGINSPNSTIPPPQSGSQITTPNGVQTVPTTGQPNPPHK